MNNFVWREFSSDDRAMAIAWLTCAARKKSGVGGSFPADFYPATGIAVYSKSKLVCVLPIYLELTSNTAVLGFCTPDPELDGKNEHQAVTFALQSALEYSQKLGKKYILGLFGNRAVNRIADRMGFITGDRNVEEKFLILK